MLELTDTGQVKGLESLGDTYVEKYSAQFFSGLLVPAFLSDLRTEALGLYEQGTLVSRISQLYTNGVNYVVLPKELEMSFARISSTNAPTMIFCGGQARTVTLNPWCEMKNEIAMGQHTGLSEVLGKYLTEPWRAFGPLNLGGAFEKNFTPGVLCISGIDWHTNILRRDCTFKRLM
ncbi:MAG: hypothetical protein QM786_01225 [Breznakibacter sp.]